MISMLADNARAQASLVSNQVDKKMHKGITPGKEDTTQYKIIRQILSDAIEVSTAKYIYTLYTDGTAVYYGVDGR